MENAGAGSQYGLPLRTHSTQSGGQEKSRKILANSGFSEVLKVSRSQFLVIESARGLSGPREGSNGGPLSVGRASGLPHQRALEAKGSYEHTVALMHRITGLLWSRAVDAVPGKGAVVHA